MPDLIRHPASPSPWAEKLFSSREGCGGWIPAHGRHDEETGMTSPARNRFTPACVLRYPHR